MKTKNENRKSISEKIEDNFILFLFFVFSSVIGLIVLFMWLNGELRSYEQRLQDYQDAKALCLETGLENDQCTIFAWKESGLDNE